MKLTVGELRKKLEGYSDDAPVFIERIEDVYFEKYGWKTNHIVFQRDEHGVPTDDTEIIQSSCIVSSKKKDKFIILAHI